jgi:hypothetical protein
LSWSCSRLSGDDKSSGVYRRLAGAHCHEHAVGCQVIIVWNVQNKKALIRGLLPVPLWYTGNVPERVRGGYSGASDILLGKVKMINYL